MAKVEMKLDSLLANDYEKLTTLFDKWLPRADDDEDAVNAVIKLMNQREQVLTKYYGLIPDDDSQLEQFRKQRDERKNKSTRKYKK